MSRWSARRGQAEPLAALAAAAVVGLALSAYVGIVPDAMPGERGANPAEPAAERASERLRDDGLVDPERLADLPGVAPDGYRVNVSVSARGQEWAVGPTPPRGAAHASRVVPVRVEGGVAAGRVRVEVWP